MSRLVALVACAAHAIDGIEAFSVAGQSPILSRFIGHTTTLVDVSTSPQLTTTKSFSAQKIPTPTYHHRASSLSSTASDTDTTKQDLLDIANDLYTNLNTQTKNEPNQWSNRYGKVITPAAIPGVYTCDVPFYWNKIDVGGRMTIIQLSSVDEESGKPDLFIHSPVGLSDDLIKAMDKLGTVKHVVSPNYEHVKYAKEWADNFPNAFMWACPGLAEREPQVRWSGEIGYKARPDGYIEGYGGSGAKVVADERMWDWSEIQPLHIDVEVNPFTNKPFFNEVVFFHTKSQTLLTTDLFWNYPGDGVTNSNYDGLKTQEEDLGVWELAPLVDRIPFGSKFWKVGMDKVYLPFYIKFMIKNDKRAEFEQLASFLSGLDQSSSSPWDVQTIIPCHGDIIRGSTFTKQVLKDHFKL